MKSKAYQQDLAYIHDAGFGEFARKSAAGLLRIFRSGGLDGGLVVDLGCGSGLWAQRLVEAGYGVLGVDLSADMIALARRRVPEAKFLTCSFLDVEFPKCAGITAMGECLNYLFDGRNRRPTLARLFRRAYEALRPGGVFVFDIAEPGRAKGMGRSFWSGPDWACLVEYGHNLQRDLLTRRITTFRKLGRSYRRAEETHVQRLYRASELAGELRAVGFRVRTIRGYGAMRFRTAQTGVVAWKPS